MKTYPVFAKHAQQTSTLLKRKEYALSEPVSTIMLMFLLILFWQNAMSQEKKPTFAGYVRDAGTGEELPAATIYFSETKSGCITNNYGFYSISLPAGTYHVRVSYVGYKTAEFTLNLTNDTKKDFELPETSNEIETVEIKAENNTREQITGDMSVSKMSIKDINKLPVLFGENDVLKSLQLLPGVQSSGDGNAGFYVRGGSIDQNLILLDEAPVYNASHLLGFFSVFNSDAIKNVTLYKGAIPPNYGGRLSSVVDVRMKEGNMKQYKVAGGIGLISSKVAIEGPIVKDESSFIFSARRTYGDLFLPLFNDPNLKNSRLYFYDLNLKANYRFSDKDRIYLSGYLGKDHFKYNENFLLDWGNTTGTLRWNHLFNDKVFANTSFITSSYNYFVQLGSNANKFSIQSLLSDFQLKSDFHYYRKPESTFRFGANLIYHKFSPGNIQSGDAGPIPPSDLSKSNALEASAYIMHEATRWKNFFFTSGFRFSFFGLLGPGDVFQYDDEMNVTDTLHFSGGSFIKTYGHIEPRFSVRYRINETSSLKLSAGKTVQYLHLLSNATSAKPTDLWIPSSYHVKPQYARQYALGYYKNFWQDRFQTSVEIYYKRMRNQIDYRNNANLLLNPDIESQVVFGEGYSYGAEFYVKYSSEKWSGWVSYTLSKTDKKFPEINNGASFPAKQDQTNNIAVVLQYTPSKIWSFSADWVYNTGAAATFPSGKYGLDGSVFNLYTERNGYRMPDYHRLDMSATLTFKKKKSYESELVFSIYNAYNRANAYSIEFRPNEDNPTQMEAVQLSLFKIVPSISYHFKF